MSLPIIAIVGRPNVGKSTLFNRLIGVRYAITSPVAGTTRDRIYHEALLGSYETILVDTGGLDFEGGKENIEADVQKQARVAVEEADLIFFLIDATQPLTANDRDAASYLRKSKKPLILVGHKSDNKKSEENRAELFELGLGDPIMVSSIHNIDIDELELATERILKKMKWKKEPRKVGAATTKIAIVGKPNVGKSSLVNALLGEDRLIVSDRPGTTIDATDTAFQMDERRFVLIDTAGLRRRGKRQGIERFGSLRALRAISRADVTCLMLDWSSGLKNQDLHVSQYALDAGKGLIIAVNKTDLMEYPYKDIELFQKKLTYRMNYMPWAPVVFVSVEKKKNILKIIENALNIAEERAKKIPEKECDLFIRTTVLAHPLTRSGKTIKIFGGMQSGICPPTFTIRTSKPDSIHFSYRRYLENEIRRRYGFFGTVIKLDFVEQQ